MSKEAMKLALEALEASIDVPCYGGHPKQEAAAAALREALAEQPAQQEPVATDWERIARVQDAKLRAMCNEPGGFERLCEVMDRYERISPPASKPWVGLTKEETGHWAQDFLDGAKWAEAKLKEKNTC